MASLEAKIQKSCEILSRFLKVSKGQNLIAFSGGKDAIVAASIAKNYAGLNLGICETSFCFKQQKKGFSHSAQRIGIEIIERDSLSLEWLAKNQKFLFAKESKIRSLSFQLRQQATMKREAKMRCATGIVFGRRTEENTLKSELYQTKSGVWSCHPIHFWKTEDVWQYFDEQNIPRPWIYETHFGKLGGNSGFLSLSHYKDFNEAWQICFDACPETVKEAANYFASARSFLNSRK